MTQSTRIHFKRFAAAVLASALTLAGVIATAPTASAAETGWVRLTHLSPDTPAVNVALTSLSNSKDVIELSEVGYGDISDYKKVAVGKYVATMTPPGGDSKSTPAVSQPVTVTANKAYTVAAVGKNADLKGVVLDDDLSPGPKGKAKIRLLQASYSAAEVTVSAEGGPTIARDARFASSTDYATVEAGVWTLRITPSGNTAEPTTAEATLASASVNTLIVLDGKDGKLTVKVIKDAGGLTQKEMPKKGVEAGGGGQADPPMTASVSPILGTSTAFVLSALALSVVALGFARRRRA